MKELVELNRENGEVFFHLAHDEEQDLWWASWVGILTDAELQRSMHRALDYLPNEGSLRCMLNHQRYRGNYRDVCMFVRALWAPKPLKNLKRRYFAHWLNSHMKKDPDYPCVDLVHGTEMGLFFKEDEALAWLLAQGQE